MLLAADKAIIDKPITEKSKQSPTALSLWLKEPNIPIVKLNTKDITTATIIKTYKKISSFFLWKRLPGLPGESHPTTRKTW